MRKRRQIVGPVQCGVRGRDGILDNSHWRPADGRANLSCHGVLLHGGAAHRIRVRPGTLLNLLRSSRLLGLLRRVRLHAVGDSRGLVAIERSHLGVCQSVLRRQLCVLRAKVRRREPVRVLRHLLHRLRDDTQLAESRRDRLTIGRLHEEIHRLLVLQELASLFRVTTRHLHELRLSSGILKDRDDSSHLLILRRSHRLKDGVHFAGVTAGHARDLVDERVLGWSRCHAPHDRHHGLERVDRRSKFGPELRFTLLLVREERVDRVRLAVYAGSEGLEHETDLLCDRQVLEVRPVVLAARALVVGEAEAGRWRSARGKREGRARLRREIGDGRWRRRARGRRRSRLRPLLRQRV